jgi:hypothetical protein
VTARKTPQRDRKKKVTKAPKLTLQAGGRPRRGGLLPEGQRRSMREAMSSCTIEPAAVGETDNREFIREIREDLVELHEADRKKWLDRAAEYDQAAKTARGMHIRRKKGYAAWAREEASRCGVYQSLPLRDQNEEEGDDSFRAGGAYAHFSSEFEDTVKWSAYDSEGRQILSARTTGSDEAQAQLVDRFEEIANLLLKLGRNGIRLVPESAKSDAKSVGGIAGGIAAKPVLTLEG